jgi:hypothetical protein
MIANDPTTLHLFATNEPKNAFDLKALRTINNPDNPVAIIRSQYNRTGQAGGRASASHFKKDKQVPRIIRLCRGAKVEIAGRNISPQLGLYNSSMGEVVDIVYKKGQSPNTGDLPYYVLVRLPSYIGKTFVHSDSSIVPIVPIHKLCSKRCCKITYIPLRVCFAKTIHTFQGSSAGPVRPGQPENSIKRLVVDIGTRQFEGNNPGLSYTAFGRATTLGDPSNVLTSSLFFDGPNLCPDRIMNITTKSDGSGYYKKVQLRQQWVRLLHQNTLHLSFSSAASRRLFNWADNHRPTEEQIRRFHSNFT